MELVQSGVRKTCLRRLNRGWGKNGKCYRALGRSNLQAASWPGGSELAVGPFERRPLGQDSLLEAGETLSCISI